MIRRVLELPVIGTALAVVMDMLLAGGDTVFAFLATVVLSLGDILPILSMVASYVAPQIDWIPEGAVQTAMLATALIVVGVQIGRLLFNN